MAIPAPEMKPFRSLPHPITEESLLACPSSSIMFTVMDGPANLTCSSALLIRIEGNVPWMWRKGSGGNYVAVCEPLKITLQARSYCELMEDISNSLDALLKELMETHDFDRFMEDHGWHLDVPIPAGPTDMRFDVPFSISPVTAGMNGSQRHVHQ